MRPARQLIVLNAAFSLFLCGIFSNAQTPSKNNQPAAVGYEQALKIGFILNQSLDAAKAKAGDPISAHPVASLRLKSGIEITQQARLIGRILKVGPYSDGKAASSLTIIFDRIELAKAGTRFLHATILAMAPPTDHFRPGFAVQPFYDRMSDAPTDTQLSSAQPYLTANGNHGPSAALGGPSGAAAYSINPGGTDSYHSGFVGLQLYSNMLGVASGTFVCSDRAAKVPAESVLVLMVAFRPAGAIAPASGLRLSPTDLHDNKTLDRMIRSGRRDRCPVRRRVCEMFASVAGVRSYGLSMNSMS